jgi:hypothetical protein
MKFVWKVNGFVSMAENNLERKITQDETAGTCSTHEDGEYIGKMMPLGVEVSSITFDLIISWRRVVSFTPLPFYSRYPLDKKQCRPQSRSKRCEEKNISPDGIRTLVVQPITRHYTDWAIPIT